MDLVTFKKLVLVPACFLFALSAGAAERAILSDGREIVCLERHPVEGGWSCMLDSGGETVLGAGRVDRFEPVWDTGAIFVEQAAPAEGAGALSPESPEVLLSRLIESVSLEFSMDPRLVEAVAWVESRHDPFAVSPKGAAGVMQLMPGTARELAVTDPFDLEQNVRGGVRLLRQLSDRLNGDLPLVLAAYNAGEGAVSRAGGIPPYRETRKYVIAVLERYLAAPPVR